MFRFVSFSSAVVLGLTLVGCPKSPEKSGNEKSEQAQTKRSTASKKANGKIAVPKKAAGKAVNTKMTARNRLDVDGTKEIAPSMANSKTVKLIPRTFEKAKIQISMPAEWKEVKDAIPVRVTVERPGFRFRASRGDVRPIQLFHDVMVQEIIKGKWKLIEDKYLDINGMKSLRMIVEYPSRDKKFTTRKVFYYLTGTHYSHKLEFGTLFQRFKLHYFQRMVETVKTLP
jgi:hypothetical protein